MAKRGRYPRRMRWRRRRRSASTEIVLAPRVERALVAIATHAEQLDTRILRLERRFEDAAVDTSLETTMVMTSNASGILQGSTDAAEARRAFAEKRRPNFTAS